MVRYAFYISGNATRFHKFLNQSTLEQRKSISLVFSDDEKTSYLRDVLTENDIEYCLYNYNCVEEKKNLALSNALLEQLNEYKIDYMFSFGAHILRGDILMEYQNRLINFHPSVLPMYPGKSAIDQAINAQKALLIGNTAHFMDEGIDTGSVIMQSVMTVERFYNGGYDAVMDVQVEMLNKLMKVIDEGRLKLVSNRPVIEAADYMTYHFFPSV